MTVGQGTAVRLSTTTTPDEGRLPPGTVIAQRYRIAARLGKGGMGEVYKAADLLLGQTVAIKFLPEGLSRDENMLERFRNEVRLARQVSHPNVCRVYDIGEADGQMFLTMEYIDGEDLASLLRRIGRLPVEKGLETARRLCAGLAAAHEKGVVHRDLKPANVMIDGRGQLLITDFGLAAIAGAVEGTDVRSGTTAYMSPEQLSGLEVTYRSDIYGLGLVLYEIFAGKPPFTATTVGELRELERAGAPPLSESVKDIDPAIERAVARCLEPEPRRRPPSALAVAAALPGGDPLAAALSAGETPSPEMVAAAGEREGLKPVWAIACFAALLVGLIAMAWVSGNSAVLSVIRLDASPEAMAQKARDMLASLGYTEKPFSAAWDYHYADARRLPRRGGRDAIAKAAAQRPPVVYFMYRSSPQLLVPHSFSRNIVEEDEPPQTVPGMINMRLDHEGRLVSLIIKPGEKDEPPAPFDFAKLFGAAGLDAAKFAPAEPRFVPPFAADEAKAWVEAGVREPLRVEAAAWRGRPVLFRMERTGTARQRASAGGRDKGSAILLAALLVSICALAWRNARLGRGDRRGASRAALVIFGVSACWSTLQRTHRFDSGEIGRVLDTAAYSLLVAAMFGLIYLALEPHVRRRWPHALIAWTRLLSGSWRDPMVGTHVLVGLLGGVAQLVLLRAYFTVTGDLTETPSLVLANGPLRVASSFFAEAMSALMGTGFAFFALFFIYRLVRIRWLAVLVTTAVFATPAVLSSSSILESAAINLVIIAAIFVVMMHYGLLAAVAMQFSFGMFGNIMPATLDSSTWYFGASWAAMAGIAALGFWAFRTSLGGRPLFKSE